MTVVQERNANNVALVSYTRGNDLSGSLQGAGGIGGLLARTDHAQQLSPDSLNAHAYYHCDGNGNVTCLINTNGQVVARYSYDPYGNLLGMSGPLAEANTNRFSSKEWHNNAGLYYYGYRFYEPNLQRWPNQDPLGDIGSLARVSAVLMPGFEMGGEGEGSEDGFLAAWTRVNLNLHRGIGNNPVVFYDPHGLAEVYCKRKDGKEERLKDASVDDLVKKLEQAAKEKNPIGDLRIKDHASKEVMQMSKESLLTTANGKILDDKGRDLTDKFKNGLTPNAMICLNGCATGRGKDNIAKDMSQILPGTIVAGGKGMFQMNIPFTSSAIGKKNYYYKGEVCHSEW